MISEATIWSVLWVSWMALGIHAYLYWWRKQYDVRVIDVVMSLPCGIFGPFGYLIGWILCPIKESMELRWPWNKVVLERKES